MDRARLSKSKILAGRQCEKRLWLETYRHDLRCYAAAAEARFAVGHQVGEAARTEFPDGILVPGRESARAAIGETRRLLAEQPRAPLFERPSSSATCWCTWMS